eukprot:121026_1
MPSNSFSKQELNNDRRRHVYFPSLNCSINRAQLSPYILPVSLLFLGVYTYGVMAYIYSLSLDTILLMPHDAILWIILLILYLISSFRVSCTSPGLVDQNRYKEHCTNINNAYDIETQFLLPQNKRQRPPKSHYSMELKSDVLRMDHFCIWYNNVVGLNNYKYFVLTLFYTFTLSNYTILVVIYRYFIPVEYSSLSWLHWKEIFVLFYIILMSIIFSIFSGILGAIHIRQINKNLSSIEYRMFRSQRRMARQFNLKWHDVHMYDYGLYKNWIAMLGKDWFLWLLPMKQHLIEDGYKYKIDQKNKEIVDEFHRLCQMAKTRPLGQKQKETYLELLNKCNNGRNII